MRIGVPTEIKSNEFRVGLVPGSVRELTARGHEVLVQSGAGLGISADNATYEKAGARIVADAAAVFRDAELIVDGFAWIGRKLGQLGALFMKPSLKA